MWSAMSTRLRALGADCRPEREHPIAQTGPSNEKATTKTRKHEECHLLLGFVSSWLRGCICLAPQRSQELCGRVTFALVLRWRGQHRAIDVGGARRLPRPLQRGSKLARRPPRG